MTDASDLLRPGLLDGLSVLIAGPPPPAGPSSERDLRGAVSDACAALGATVRDCWPISDRSDLVDEATLDAAVAAALDDAGKIDLLVVDGAGLFAHGLASGAALRMCMDAAWHVTRAVANRAFLAVAEAGGRPAGGERPTGGPGGRIVYLAPTGPDRFGAHAEAACAGLENLARTLSIEWARHGITALAVAPGAGDAAAGEAAALTAYLASPAAAYFSGCLFDLRGPDGGPDGGAASG